MKVLAVAAAMAKMVVVLVVAVVLAVEAVGVQPLEAALFRLRPLIMAPVTFDR